MSNLTHYGVKGMKWDETKGKLTPEEKERLRKEDLERREQKRSAADERKLRKGVNEGARVEKRRAKKEGRTYDEVEAKQFWANLFEKHPNMTRKEIDKEEKQRRWRAKIKIRQMLKLKEDLEQSEGGDMKFFTWDENGNPKLEHHGIKGMRWGVRRKNPSGGKTSGQTSTTSTTRSSDSATAAALKGRSLATMSNKEIQTLAARLDLEKRYAALNPKQQSISQKLIQDFFQKFPNKLVEKSADYAATVAWRIIQSKLEKKIPQLKG